MLIKQGMQKTEESPPETGGHEQGTRTQKHWILKLQTSSRTCWMKQSCSQKHGFTLKALRTSTFRKQAENFQRGRSGTGPDQKGLHQIKEDWIQPKKTE